MARAGRGSRLVHGTHVGHPAHVGENSDVRADDRAAYARPGVRRQSGSELGQRRVRPLRRLRPDQIRHEQFPVTQLDRPGAREALRAACVGGAAAGGETDRGRLTVGQLADLVVVPAAILTDPEFLRTCRPRLVMTGGAVAFEA